MKIRNGFVSNSSSSSFVVVFPREPKSMLDVKEMLFSDGETSYCSPYDDKSWSVEQVAETVWNDICAQEKNNLVEAKERLMSGTIYDSDAPDYDDYRHIKDWTKKMEAYNRDCGIFADKKMKEFFNIRKLKLQQINNEPIDFGALYCFSYADEDGSYGSALEHGDLFRNLKHIHISNH